MISKIKAKEEREDIRVLFLIFRDFEWVKNFVYSNLQVSFHTKSDK